VERCDSERIDNGESQTLSGVEQQGLDGGRVMIYRRRAEEPSGVVWRWQQAGQDRRVDPS
jgi:hypothetical protein